MEKPDISVVIPTYNRVESLLKTLDLLAVQTYPCTRFEVVVVDDGSTDDTGPAVSAARAKYPYHLSYLGQRNAGPAAARNTGISAARSDIILLIGDDILPAANLVECHIRSHKKFPGTAVLGMVEWPPDDLEITDFMRYLAPEGPQFRFLSIKDPMDCGFRRFYTSNISLGRKWFQDDLFDEEFPFAGFEDTDLGYRLERKGLKIIFDKDAMGYHRHAITLDSYLTRMRLSGISGEIFKRKHPEVARVALPVNITLAKTVFYPLRSLGFVMKHLSKRLYWSSLLVASYIEGMEEHMRRRDG